MGDIAKLEVPDAFREKYKSSYFDSSKIQLSSPRYVAWVDLMGSSSAMRRSHVQAAVAIGQFHSTIMTASNDTRFLNKGKIYPLVDGVYITTTSRTKLQEFMKYIFKLNCINFILTDNFANLRPIRGAIAFGQVIEGENIKNSSFVLEKNFDSHTSKVLLGAPLALAHSAERKASPMGVWIDESARQFCPANGKTIRWTNWPWWGYKTDKEKIDSDCVDIEKMTARKLNEYYEWLKNNYISALYEKDRLNDHMEKARQYFPSWI